MLIGDPESCQLLTDKPCTWHTATTKGRRAAGIDPGSLLLNLHGTGTSKLLVTSASLLVTSALLVVTMFAIRNNKLLGTSASLLVTSALIVVTRS